MRKHSSKEPPERKHHRSNSPSKHSSGRDIHGKYKVEEKYRGGSRDYIPPREDGSPRSQQSKGDLDIRDRDLRMSPDISPFAHKERSQRRREGIPSGGTQNQSFMFDKKDHQLMRDEGYHRGENLRRSPDHHGSTLDERFRHSSEKQIESRLQFNREELEKITIDIRRNVREPSPTLRRIINPEEIKVVRRPGEGHRPLFEREEIKKPLVDLREDASFERHVSIMKRESSGNSDYDLHRKSLIPMQDDLRTEEFGEISHQTLSDRWQSYDRKPSSQIFRSHRDLSEERGHSFKQGGSPLPYRDQEFRGGSPAKNSSRDFSREDRRSFDRESHVRHSRDSEDRDFGRPFLDDPGDLRFSLSRRKEGSLSDDQHRLSDRSQERRDSKWREFPRKDDLDISSGRYRVSRSRHHSRSRSPIHDRERRDSSREDRGIDFSQRPDRFKYAPWAEKPEVIPKGPSYYEHDDRGENDINRRRGRGRILRPRGFRGRIMRGTMRGNFRGRIFRGNLNRGRPFVKRQLTPSSIRRSPSRF